MAKKARKRAPKKVVRRRRSRVEQERRMRQYVIWATVVVGVLVVGLVVYGLLARQIKTAIAMHKPAAIVNGVEITLGELRQRVRSYEALQGPLQPELTGYVLDELIKEELVRQEAARRGIAFSPEEVQDRIERQFGFHRTPPTPEPTPMATLTPTMTEMPALTPTEAPTLAATSTPVLPTPTPVTEEGFRKSYDEYLKLFGVSDAYFRSEFEARMLQEALLDDFGKEIPLTIDQVQLRYLRVVSETQASELLTALVEGDGDFESLKEEASEVGDLAWYPKAILSVDVSEEVAEQAFALEAGTGVFSQTVVTDYGATSYYIVEVVDHQVREVDETMREQLAQQAFDEWMDGQMAQVERLEYDPSLVVSEASTTDTGY
jgi:parvulin-like peptidyl-prolyl isomerase